MFNLNASLIVIALLLIYKFLRRRASFFERRNVKTLKSAAELDFMFTFLIMKRHINDVSRDYYNQFSSERFEHILQIPKPSAFDDGWRVIADSSASLNSSSRFIPFEIWSWFEKYPSRISRTNHRSVIDERADSLFGNNLFILRDQKWRSMRPLLTPTFTGSKMRQMFNLITNITSAYASGLCEKEIEFKDLANKYCHDVIAKCSFGVSSNSLANPDNEFYKMGLYVTKFPLAQQLKFIGYSAFPWLMNARSPAALFLAFTINFS